MNPRIYLTLSLSLLYACGSTGVVKLEKNKYIISEKNTKVGFVSAAEEKAAVYKKANEFCDQKGKEVKTLNLEMRDSGLFKQASATLEFSCIKQ